MHKYPAELRPAEIVAALEMNCAVSIQPDII